MQTAVICYVFYESSFQPDILYALYLKTFLCSLEYMKLLSMLTLCLTGEYVCTHTPIHTQRRQKKSPVSDQVLNIIIL